MKYLFEFSSSGTFHLKYFSIIFLDELIVEYFDGVIGLVEGEGYRVWIIKLIWVFLTWSWGFDSRRIILRRIWWLFRLVILSWWVGDVSVENILSCFFVLFICCCIFSERESWSCCMRFLCLFGLFLLIRRDCLCIEWLMFYLFLIIWGNLEIYLVLHLLQVLGWICIFGLCHLFPLRFSRWFFQDLSIFLSLFSTNFCIIVLCSNHFHLRH